MITIFEQLFQMLKQENIDFRHVQHAPTRTCEESAAARGEALEIGAKAILIRFEETYVLFVLSAAKKLDSKRVKAIVKCKSIRFATPEELKELTTLVPGCVPPFGQPLFPFKLYIDETISKLPKIAFNAGLLTDSIIMKTEDYLRLSNGEIENFSQD